MEFLREAAASAMEAPDPGEKVLKNAMEYVIQGAVSLYKMYRARDGERKSFALCAPDSLSQHA